MDLVHAEAEAEQLKVCPHVAHFGPNRRLPTRVKVRCLFEAGHPGDVHYGGYVAPGMWVMWWPPEGRKDDRLRANRER